MARGPDANDDRHAAPEWALREEDRAQANIAILARLKGHVNTDSIPDRANATVTGAIGTIDAGEQLLTLQCFAARGTPR